MTPSDPHFLAGQPMPEDFSEPATGALDSTPEAARAWAQGVRPHTRWEQIRHTDWAQTFRLSGPRGDTYLKCVPRQRADQLRRAARIAQHFPHQVPRVLAVDPHHGWLLSEDHQGVALEMSEREQALERLLQSWAALQATAGRDAALMDELDAIPLARLADNLASFLSSPADAAGRATGAASLLGAAEAQRWHQLLGPALPLLHKHIGSAQRLPNTLLHGDLHTGNVAETTQGQLVFFDWDECARGPAGACLHSLFNGCTVPAILLTRWAATGIAPDTPDGHLLESYVNALVELGHAPLADLLAGLPGAVCAGQVAYVLSYADFPAEASAGSSAAMVRRLLANLLDLCDWLAAKDAALALDTARRYQSCGEWQRAKNLVQDQVARGPAQPEHLVWLSELARRCGDLSMSEEAARESIDLAPALAAGQRALASVLLARLDLDGAQTALAQAQIVEPGHADSQALASRLAQVQRTLADAQAPDGWPKVQISSEERLSGQLLPETHALIVRLFRDNGAVQLDGAFDPAWIASMNLSFSERYGDQFHAGHHADALQVGDKRYMLTMGLDDVFGAPEFVASSLLLPLMKQLLGEECILGAYTAVVSLPGSEPQKIHKDHSALFDEAGWQLALPSFSAQIIVPLVPLDDQTGATRVFKASQRVPLDKAALMPSQVPVVPLGSCVLLDYSVAHHGLGNRSEQVRPILNLIYCRPWFRDTRNYHLQPPLRFAQGYVEQAPDAVKGLIAWWDLERRTAQQA